MEITYDKAKELCKGLNKTHNAGGNIVWVHTYRGDSGVGHVFRAVLNHPKVVRRYTKRAKAGAICAIKTPNKSYPGHEWAFKIYFYSVLGIDAALKLNYNVKSNRFVSTIDEAASALVSICIVNGVFETVKHAVENPNPT